MNNIQQETEASVCFSASWCFYCSLWLLSLETVCILMSGQLVYPGSLDDHRHAIIYSTLKYSLNNYRDQATLSTSFQTGKPPISRFILKSFCHRPVKIKTCDCLERPQKYSYFNKLNTNDFMFYYSHLSSEPQSAGKQMTTVWPSHDNDYLFAKSDMFFQRTHCVHMCWKSLDWASSQRFECDQCPCVLMYFSESCQS